MEIAREPFELGSARGFRYGELPAGILRSLPGWLERGAVGPGEGEVLKAGTVWRVGSYAVKVYPRRGGLEGWFRQSPALRAAELARVLPVRTPRPWLALEQATGPRRGTGLSVSELVEGRYLHILWDDEPAAREAFAGFMLGMHTHGVFHGDLNVWNVLWNGSEWVLLDLESVRRGLQAVLPRRLIEAQWARVIAALRGRPGSRELFESYLAAAGRDDHRGELWRRIETRARQTVARWDAQRGGPPADLPASARWR